MKKKESGQLPLVSPFGLDFLENKGRGQIKPGGKGRSLLARIVRRYTQGIFGPPPPLLLSLPFFSPACPRATVCCGENRAVCIIFLLCFGHIATRVGITPRAHTPTTPDLFLTHHPSSLTRARAQDTHTHTYPPPKVNKDGSLTCGPFLVSSPLSLSRFHRVLRTPREQLLVFSPVFFLRQPGSPANSR